MQGPWSTLLDIRGWHRQRNILSRFEEIRQFLDELPGECLPATSFVDCVIEGQVHVAPTASVHPFTMIRGPAWVGPGCELGPHCYIRPYSVLESEVRIGFGVEVKGSLIGDGTRISHLSYVGDSLVGRRVMIGAAFCATVERLDRGPIILSTGGRGTPTGRRKLGCIIGDDTCIGASVTTLPGAVIGAHCQINPRTLVARMVADDTVVSPGRQPNEL